MKKLNKAQALALFEENAILFGDRDAVPETTAAALLGRPAIDYLMAEDKTGSRGFWNAIGMNDHIPSLVTYITFAGFMRAVTYNNALAVIGPRKGKIHHIQEAQEV